MIEVVCHPSGDIAYAEDPEAALVAAKTLCNDSYSSRCWGERAASFYVDGVLVRGPIPEASLWVS